MKKYTYLSLALFASAFLSLPMHAMMRQSAQRLGAAVCQAGKQMLKAEGAVAQATKASHDSSTLVRNTKQLTNNFMQQGAGNRATQHVPMFMGIAGATYGARSFSTSQQPKGLSEFYQWQQKQKNEARVLTQQEITIKKELTDLTYDLAVIGELIENTLKKLNSSAFATMSRDGQNREMSVLLNVVMHSIPDMKDFRYKYGSNINAALSQFIGSEISDKRALEKVLQETQKELSEYAKVLEQTVSQDLYSEKYIKAKIAKTLQAMRQLTNDSKWGSEVEPELTMWGYFISEYSYTRAVEKIKKRLMVSEDENVTAILDEAAILRDLAKLQEMIFRMQSTGANYVKHTQFQDILKAVNDIDNRFESYLKAAEKKNMNQNKQSFEQETNRQEQKEEFAKQEEAKQSQFEQMSAAQIVEMDINLLRQYFIENADAYHTLAKRYQPDVNGEPEANEAFKKINEVNEWYRAERSKEQ